MEPRRIDAAIAAIEQQRDLLDERVAEIVLAALRDQRTAVDSIETPSRHDTRRKLVTILFAKFDGLTRQAEALATANVLYLVNMLWRRFDAIITEHGGHVDSHVGDVVMGVFGVPVAAEDDAERALRAALALRAAVGNFLQELRQQAALDAVLQPELSGMATFDLAIQVGINSGPVLLSEVGSGGEYTALGDTVNVASRLQQKAPPGGILVADATHRLVADLFETDGVAPLTVRGKAQPIPARLLLGVKTRRFFASARGIEGVETRLVGRDEELLRLTTAVDQTHAQRVPHHTLLVGDAGVGKSRLVMECLDRVPTDDSVCLLRGRTEPRWQQLPLALLRDVLLRTCDVLDGDAPAVVLAKLESTLMGLLGLDAVAARAYGLSLAQAVGLDLGQVNELEMRREQSVARFVAFLQAIADRYALAVLVLEDLHWADEGSLACIAALQEGVTAVPLAIVATTRPALLERWDGWQGDRLPLRPLSRSEARELAADILRRVDNLPASLLKLIVDTAEGNPFYLEELIKVLIEDGVIVVDDEAWHVALSSIPQLRVPASLTGVLQARLERLSMEERLTLQRAAVVGREFWESAVQQLSQTEIRPLGPARVQAALRSLAKRELIFRVPMSTLSDEAAFAFKHAILREVAYEGVLLRERPVYHRAAADWLTIRSADRLGEVAAVVAGHYELAGEWLAAADLYETAGLRAADMHEPAEAIGHFRKVLALNASRPLPMVGLLEVQAQLVRLLQMQARLLDAEQMVFVLRAAAETDGDLAMQVHAWLALAGLYVLQAAWEAVLEAARQAERLARLFGSEPQQVRALCLQGQALTAVGEWTSARDVLDLAEETAVRLNLTAELSDCLSEQVRLALASGDTAAAHAALARLWSVAQNDPAAGGGAVARAALAAGEFEGVGGWLETAVAECDARGEVAERAALLAVLGRVWQAVGEGATAVAVWRKSLAAAESVGHLLDAFDVRLSLAMCLLEMGEVGEATAVVAPVRQFVQETGQLREWTRLSDLEKFV